MASKIQIRRDTAINWSYANPILSQGEIGLEIDTKLIKIGDGITTWSGVPYYGTVVSGAVDHGILLGLSDDDHTQYLNTTRGDERYYTEAESDYRHVHAYTGVIDEPTYTYSGSGYITVPNITALFNTLSTGAGDTYILPVMGDTLFIPEDQFITVVCNYNSGSPIYEVFTVDRMEEVDNNNVLLYTVLFRFGDNFLSLPIRDMTAGVGNKLHVALSQGVGLIRMGDTGFDVSISGSNYLNITGGTLLIGAQTQPHADYNSSINDLYFFYHDGDNWEYTINGILNTSTYDSGSELVPLTDSYYSNLWIYKTNADENVVSYFTSTTEYATLELALAADIPTELPPICSVASLLVARITIQKGITGGYVSSAFIKKFAGIVSNNHNALVGLQGGASENYYHLLQVDYNNLTAGTPIFDSVTADHYGDGSNLTNIIHATLSGLSGDDHSQYHTDARGDARYYTQSQVTTISGDIIDILDTHKSSSDHDSRYYTETEADYMHVHKHTGIIEDPTFTYPAPILGSGYVAVPTVNAVFDTQPDASGDIYYLTVTGTELFIPEDQFNTIVVKYNGGNPVYDVFAIEQMGQVDNNSVLLWGPIFRYGDEILSFPVRDMTAGLGNKLHITTSQALGPIRMGNTGFEVSISGSNYLCISGGMFLVGAQSQVHTDYNSGESHLHFYYHDAEGNWTHSIEHQLNNIQYDTPTGLATLTDGYYSNLWIYKMNADEMESLYITSPDQYASLESALATDIPQDTPQIATLVSALVARVTVQKGGTAGNIFSAFTKRFAGISPISHNNLIGLQGGDEGYYHLNTSDYTNLTNGNPIFDTVTATTFSGGGAALTNIYHGTLSGLLDDDHTQYHTDVRGDIRYYTKSQIDTISGSINTTFNNYYTKSEITTISGNIVDQIPTEFDELYYTKSEIDTISGVITSQHYTDENAQDAIGNNTYGVGLVSILYNDSLGTITISGSQDDTKVDTTHINETTDKHPFVSNLLSTGLFEGGELSINSEDPTTFDIAEGWGIIVNNYSDASNPTRKIVTWPTTTGIVDLYLDSSDETGVYITRAEEGDGVGTINQKDTSTYTAEERRDYLELGWTSHVARDVIEDAKTEPVFIPDTMNQVLDFINSFGIFNIDGNIYAAVSGSLNISRSAGTTFSVGANYEISKKSPNILTTNAEDPVAEIYYYYREAGEWVNDTPPSTSGIDPNHYDSGDGLETVASGSWTIQTIFYYPLWESTEVQYGQAVYDTKDEALAATTLSIEIDSWLAYDTFRAWLIVKQGATDISNTDEAEILTAGKFGLNAGSAGGTSGGSTGGEANTSSNAGLYGIGIVLPKSGVDLPFKSIDAGSTKISITDDATNHSIDIDVVESNLDHGSIGGLADDDHTQYHNDTRGDSRYYTKSEVDTISGSLDSTIDTTSGTLTSALTNHKSSGDHDSRYYTETEVNTISGAINTKLDTHKSSSDHDSRYYTEAEVTTISGDIVSQLTTHKSSSDHDSRYYTESEIATISGNIVSQIITSHNALTGILGGGNYHLSADSYANLTGNNPTFTTVTGTYYGDGQYLTVSGVELSNVAFKNQSQTITGGWTFTTTSPEFWISPVFGNDVIWLARNSSGSAEDVLWARASDNNTYFNYGEGGHFYLRNNSAVTQYDFSDTLADFKDSAITTTSGITANYFVGDGSLITDVNRDTQQTSSDGTSTTTSTSWQNKVSLSTGTLAAGTYRVGWYFEWYYTNTTRNFQAQVQIDNTTTIMSMVQEPEDAATSQSQPKGGFYYTTFATTTTHTIDLDYRSSNPSDTAGIKNARLEIWRI